MRNKTFMLLVVCILIVIMTAGCGSETGEIKYDDGTRYEGEIKRGEAHGYGVLYNEDGIRIYQGEFKEDKKHGYGILYLEDGEKLYEGEWEDDKPID